METIPFKHTGYDSVTAEAIQLRARMGRVLNYLQRALTGEDSFGTWSVACEAVCRNNPNRLNRKQMKLQRKLYRIVRKTLQRGEEIRSRLNKLATFS